MTKQFQKNKEDFVCEKCGNQVVGNGFTNHCPKCLWSKHVDVYPGDRQAECGGMMRATKIEIEKGEWVLTHTCEKCTYSKRNKISKEDDVEKITEIAKKIVI
jgi:Zn finger protein HypA/HybF involved in hydrogenase expression